MQIKLFTLTLFELKLKFKKKINLLKIFAQKKKLKKNIIPFSIRKQYWIVFLSLSVSFSLSLSPIFFSVNASVQNFFFFFIWNSKFQNKFFFCFVLFRFRSFSFVFFFFFDLKNFKFSYFEILFKKKETKTGTLNFSSFKSSFTSNVNFLKRR